MLTLFKSVAEAIASRGLVSLARELPLGSTLMDIASEAWRRYRGARQVEEIREDAQKIAQATAAEVKQLAAEAARAAAPNEPAKATEIELYLTQMQAQVRQTFRRSSDPSGVTIPPMLELDRPEQLLSLLPARVSQFRPGDALPGREGWRLTELLGIGGFGEVWLAAHPRFASLKRAIKFCLDLSAADRTLLHEGGLIDRVMHAGSVPNVVPLIDAHLEGDAPWLMYEYVGGGDLAGLVAEWGQLPAAERQTRALAALRQVATAVAHFHRLRPSVVHRDLKPANVLVDLSRDASSPVLKVADFGIGGIAARKELDAAYTATVSRLTTAARGAYTPNYASPQHRRGLPPDPRDDVYALGVIGYQLLVGDVTAERPGGKGWRRDLQNRGADTALLDLLESCWDDDPAERPADAGELLTRLEAKPQPLPSVPGPTASPPAPSGKPEPPPIPAERREAATERQTAFLEELKRLQDKYRKLREPLPVSAIAIIVILVLATLYATVFTIATVHEDFRFQIGLGLVVSNVLFWGLIWLRLQRPRERLKRSAAAITDAIARDYAPEVASWGGRQVLDREEPLNELIRAVSMRLEPTPRAAPDRAAAKPQVEQYEAEFAAGILAPAPTPARAAAQRDTGENRTLTTGRQAVLLGQLKRLKDKYRELNARWTAQTIVLLVIVFLATAYLAVTSLMLVNGTSARDEDIAHLMLAVLIVAHAIFWPLFLRSRRQRRESLERSAAAIADGIARDFAPEVESWGGREVLDKEETVEELIHLVRRAI
jgi:serine/threonine protein kinase